MTECGIHLPHFTFPNIFVFDPETPIFYLGLNKIVQNIIVYTNEKRGGKMFDQELRQAANLEEYFNPFYQEIIGRNQTFQTPYGEKRICYADWTASGRLYKSIEEKITHQFGSFVANTHTETNITGKTMTEAYHLAKKIIKQHCHANEKDVLLFEGTGMTGAICKLQRLLSLSVHERYKQGLQIEEQKRPVVFISHMEHHSNQTTWEETLADVVVVPPNIHGDVCPNALEITLKRYQHRPLKIGAFTACSNVTGLQTPYHHLARVMHKNGGLCFIDFSASAPYVAIDMHPSNPADALDAVFLSPHKFLGGPGSSGVVIFSEDLYKNFIPDRPGGGTVKWTNPWGGKSYHHDIEEREDGGTPGFLQAIRAALAVKLKEKMGVENMLIREKALLDILFARLEQNKRVIILEGHKKQRLPIVSFYVKNLHHNLIVKLLNDVHGVQVRGGCSCAGTYGHHLLQIGKHASKKITDEIDKGNLYGKPGWVRISLHPTTRTEEVHGIADSINDVVHNIDFYKKNYRYVHESNEFKHFRELENLKEEWFEL